MKITVDHYEIEDALKNYVATQGIDISNKDITVSMLAGRGSNGYSANISIDKPKKTAPISEPIIEEKEEMSDPITEAASEEVDDEAEIDFG